MEQNPYESPKEVSSPPTVKAGVAVGVSLLTVIPAGCICGGITCGVVGASGMVAPSSSEHPTEAGYILAMPIGLIVAVLIPVLAVWLFGKRENKT